LVTRSENLTLLISNLALHYTWRKAYGALGRRRKVGMLIA